MFNFAATDAVTVLRKASNVNAAIKKFLKREVRRGDALERIVKDLREHLLAKDPEAGVRFLERERPQGDAVAVALGGYAFPELVNSIATPIIETHADSFNQSYTVKGEEIEITDPKTFSSVVKDVEGRIASGISGAGFGESTYLSQVVLSTIFDRPVLRQILSR